MAIRRREALEYHEEGRPGKIAVVPTKAVGTQRDLSLAYSPGVAEPVREIAANPEDVFRYTARGNLVAVVSNGTAILGLGDLGALASKPVMEGKGVLFKRFADIDVFDIEVDTHVPAEIIRFCELLEPTVGGINLEDIKAPECFEIEETLRERLQIPVFHDDQHGTAIISGAALLNALEIVGKKIDEVKVVFSGAGASAIATATHYLRLGVKRENVFMCDRKGVITTDRPEMDKYKARFAQDTHAHTIAEALKDADVFVGLSAAGVISGEMVATMAENPIIFALANPDPEITPEEVAAVRNDAIMATGRSDYPNQVNNVLGFPFIFRGALDVRARAINDEMKMAATLALAGLAKEDVPESVAAAYGKTTFSFGRDYLIPKPFDTRVFLRVSTAVAEAAMRTGVARTQIDLDRYRHVLEARLGRRREVMREILDKAAADPKRIAFPEGTNPRVIRAAAACVEEGIAQPVLIGKQDVVEAAAANCGCSLEGIEVIDPMADAGRLNRYGQRLFERRQRKGMTEVEARGRVQRPIYFACAMLIEGDVDGIVAGQDSNYPETIKPALQVVGLAPETTHVAGLYMMIMPHEVLFFADTTVNVEPSDKALAEIALLSAAFVRRLGIEPNIAMLSFSNFGSSRNDPSNRVASAVKMVKERAPDLIIDGEMQVDTALDPELLKERYPFSRLQTRANVLIFPDLDAANISYKLMWRAGGAEAVGPILLGMAKPVHVLQRGVVAADIVNLTAIAVVDAQERARGRK